MPVPSPAPPEPWWKDAVFYQVYVRSFADSDGDGVGDLAGITSRLAYLGDLGVDAVWLTPFYRSPQADHGYDVADPCDVDPLFGDLAAFDTLLAAAHDAGLKIVVDVVPNHSSAQHRWFEAALAAGPGSPLRGRYVFRDGRGDAGDEPPNNWPSAFGGRAWTRVGDGQWYLHLFDPSQPDFDWNHPDVGDEFERVLRFWLDRGVDGFRIDVANGLVKADGLPDLTSAQLASEATDLGDVLSRSDRPYSDQPAVHEVYRRWHRVLAGYDGDRMAVAEAWVGTAEAMSRYVRDDELQQAFNFHWLQAGWSGDQLRQVVTRTLAATEPVGASPTWVLSNHDVVRTVSRYGDGETGLSRARAALLAMLALPGSAYLYQGEELGLPQVHVPPRHRQDPAYHRGRGAGRDGCRVPIPWAVAEDGSAHGFSPDGAAAPWLPQPVGWGAWSVEAQRPDPASTWTFVRDALRLRAALVPGLDAAVELPAGDDDVFVLSRPARTPGLAGLTCVLATGGSPVDLADLGVDPGMLLLGSRADAVRDGAVQPDSGAWFRGG